MARIYTDVSLFGPATSRALPDNFDILSKEKKNKANSRVKESKDLITKGQKRVMEDVKEIRQKLYFLVAGVAVRKLFTNSRIN